MSCLFAGCSLANCGKQENEIHLHVIRFGFELEVMMQTLLVNMYYKYRIVKLAERLLNRMSMRRVEAWKAKIGGYVLNWSKTWRHLITG